MEFIGTSEYILFGMFSLRIELLVMVVTVTHANQEPNGVIGNIPPPPTFPIT